MDDTLRFVRGDVDVLESVFGHEGMFISPGARRA
jgi:hypothetical protein